MQRDKRINLAREPTPDQRKKSCPRSKSLDRRRHPALSPESWRRSQPGRNWWLIDQPEQIGTVGCCTPGSEQCLSQPDRSKRFKDDKNAGPYISLSVNLGANLCAVPTRSWAGWPSNPLTNGVAGRPAAGSFLLPGKHLDQFGVFMVFWNVSSRNALQRYADNVMPKKDRQVNFWTKVKNSLSSYFNQYTLSEKMCL